MYESERELVEELTRKGFGVVTPDQFRVDIPEDFLEIWRAVSPFTMTSLERGYALYEALRYLEGAGIPGDVVECGVWKGGSCMLAARTLLALSGGRAEEAGRRSIYLYDTFAGPTRPTSVDRIRWNGSGVLERWEADRSGAARNFTAWSVGMEEVAGNMAATGFPRGSTVLVPGDVASTLSEKKPSRIALLRLDTDWYESTKAELEALYPCLSPGGVLIVDDYGHFEGARRAVDEFFAPERGNPILLNRIDYTGRIGVKMPSA